MCHRCNCRHQTKAKCNRFPSKTSLLDRPKSDKCSSSLHQEEVFLHLAKSAHIVAMKSLKSSACRPLWILNLDPRTECQIYPEILITSSFLQLLLSYSTEDHCRNYFWPKRHLDWIKNSWKCSLSILLWFLQEFFHLLVNDSQL